jgi:two-component system, LytTR family, sensor kinase
MPNWTSRQPQPSRANYEPDPSHWAYQGAFWGCWISIGLFFGLVYNKLTYSETLSVAVLGFLSFLLSELMARYMHYRGWVRGPRRRAFGMLMLAIAAAIVLQALVDPLFVFVFHTHQLKELVSAQAILSSTMQFSLSFWCWSAMYHGIHLRRRYEKSEMERLQLEAAVQAAELRALKSQVNPHFLFNCLNNLRSLVAENPARAREMMLRLSELLRYALEVSRHERVTLTQELDVVEAYLDLESMQFEDRLRWSVEVAAGAAVGRERH